MKDIYKQQELIIPEGVCVNIKARVIHVSGPRGELVKNFKHVQVDLFKTKNRICIVTWHGHKKQIACLRTIRSLIHNMITGVTKGFRYKMRFVYAHFPINVSISDDQKIVEIRNFLGEKVTRYVTL
ncbi:hypothetical protein PCK1_003185, partial [Pneumocystis canis]